MSKESKINQSVEPIQFKLVEIRKNNFVQNDYREFGFSENDILLGQGRLNVKFELVPNEEIFSIILNMDYIKDDHVLFGIETLHKYGIKDFRTVLNFKESGQFTVIDDVMKLWLQIAINDTRGMLVILNSDHEYSKIIMPLIDLNSFIKSLKGNVADKPE
ncbi:MAG: hypothetical protein COT43_02030 [Candidatus Marinimicrobia bacterium CG08_land_8_20_14_0_20_45_22]|nr:MAG: hypothetical protein COT43_02030 [Candidatus Marinimicrobia bacterium CG08_land_8_20_14_0_20_45_22]